MWCLFEEFCIKFYTIKLLKQHWRFLFLKSDVLEGGEKWKSSEDNTGKALKCARKDKWSQ